MTKRWRCSVCGFIHQGDKPPGECLRCSSNSGEFKELKEKIKLEYDKKKFDVLIVNGSSHHSHNTNILVNIAERELKRRKISYKRINLNELDIYHCWCCYSMADAACTYPCRNQLDDMPALHEMFLQSKAVIVASPINWNNMSARLKDFLDRLTCIENMNLISGEIPTAGKVLGILINGHEDGAIKTAMDIFIYFQQMGFILAPFGFAYRTHGSEYNAKTDNNFLSGDKQIKEDIKGTINNVIEMMKLDSENKLLGKLSGVSE